VQPGKKLSSELLDACEGRGVQPAAVDWPTKQSLSGKVILDLLNAQLSSVPYKLATSLRRDCPQLM
jgi:hypothetical protein